MATPTVACTREGPSVAHPQKIEEFRKLERPPEVAHPCASKARPGNRWPCCLLFSYVNVIESVFYGLACHLSRGMFGFNSFRAHHSFTLLPVVVSTGATGRAIGFPSLSLASFWYSLGSTRRRARFQAQDAGTASQFSHRPVFFIHMPMNMQPGKSGRGLQSQRFSKTL